MLAVYDAEDLAKLGLAWWTYAAIARVEMFLQGRNARVFEFGSGASTLWLARRADHVYSVEHDLEFAEVVAGLEPSIRNVTFITAPPVMDNTSEMIRSGRKGFEGLDFTDYVKSIEAIGGTFDLIVIDGRARIACLERAVEHLSPDGLILFDDIRRPRYRSALERRDMDVEVLAGPKPSIPFPDATALMRPSTYEPGGFRPRSL
jgi:hypothetical protein